MLVHEFATLGVMILPLKVPSSAVASGAVALSRNGMLSCVSKEPRTVTFVNKAKLSIVTKTALVVTSTKMLPSGGTTLILKSGGGACANSAHAAKTVAQPAYPTRRLIMINHLSIRSHLMRAFNCRPSFLRIGRGLLFEPGRGENDRVSQQR